MDDLILFLLVFFVFLGVAYWRRRVSLRKSKQVLPAGDNTSVKALLLKVLFCLGMLCMVANAVFQAIEIKKRNARTRKFTGRVAFDVVRSNIEDGVCHIKGELYNGLKSRILVAEILPGLTNPQVLESFKINGGEPVYLTALDYSTRSIELPYDHVITVNLSVCTNLMPCHIAWMYKTPDGCSTNYVYVLDCNTLWD